MGDTDLPDTPDLRKRKRGADSSTTQRYPYIRYCIDMGTSRLKHAFTIIEHEGQEPNNSTHVHFVRMGPLGSFTAPMVLFYDADDNLIWGHEAEARLASSRSSDQILRRKVDMIKMATWAAKLEEGKRQMAQVNAMGKRLWDVIGDCLRAYTQCMLPQAQALLEQFGYSEDACDVELLLCVPQLWDMDTKKRFAQAGKATGAKSVRLVPEAFSAAAYIATERGVSQRLQNGSYVIVCDIGGGSADYSTIRLESTGAERARDPTKAVKSKLRLVGYPECHWSGSSFINASLFKKVQAGIRAYYQRSMVAQEKFTEEQLYLRAKQLLEKLKLEMTLHHLGDATKADEPVDAGVIGGPEIRVSDDRYIVTLTKRDIHASFEDVIQANLTYIQSQMSDIPATAFRIISIPGGLGACEWFVRRVQDAFSYPNVLVQGRTQSQENAPVLGACMRFTSASIDQIPPDVQFGISVDETFDKRQHRDAARRPELIKSSEAGGRMGKESWMVQDRLRWLLKRDQQLAQNTPYTNTFFQEHYIDCADPQPLHLPIYCTTHPLSEHTALRESTDPRPHHPTKPHHHHRSSLRPEIFEWGTMQIPVSKLNLHNKEITKHADGSKAWLVVTQVVLERFGGDVTFGWRIGTLEELRSREARKRSGGGGKEEEGIVWADCERLVLCDRRCNPFVFENAC